jgi:hypothetical protein
MNLHAQPCLILVKDTLSNIQIEFKIDNNKFKRKVTNYEEGKFIDYYFENSSIITLFKGSNQKIPLLSVDEGYKVIKCEKKNNRTICQGRKDGKYWREDVFINEIIVCYDNVESAKKDYYDKVLDSIFLINIVSSDDFVATINKKGFRYI